MSLGLLSRWYNNLKPMPTRAAIATPYRALTRWCEPGCATYRWSATPAPTTAACGTATSRSRRHCHVTSQQAWLRSVFLGSRKLYNTLVILLHFMDVVAPRHHWRARLKNLLATRFH